MFRAMAWCVAAVPQGLRRATVDAILAAMATVQREHLFISPHYDDAALSCGGLIAQLSAAGKRVIVAGLDLDYRGLPFGPMPNLMCRAEYVSKQLAICMVCGDPAGFTQRLTPSRDQIQVGASGMYEARCRHHFEPPHAEP